MFFQEVKIEHEQKTMKLAEVKKVSLGPLLLLLKMMTLVENNDPGPFKAFEIPGQPTLYGSIMEPFLHETFCQARLSGYRTHWNMFTFLSKGY